MGRNIGHIDLIPHELSSGIGKTACLEKLGFGKTFQGIRLEISKVFELRRLSSTEQRIGCFSPVLE
jgi:hypothetical protein